MSSEVTNSRKHMIPMMWLASNCADSPQPNARKEKKNLQPKSAMSHVRKFYTEFPYEPIVALERRRFVDVSEIRKGFAILVGTALRRPRPRTLASDRFSRCSALSPPLCGATGSQRPAPFVPAARPPRSRLRLALALGRRFAPTAPRPPPAPRASERPAARFALRAPPSPRMSRWPQTRRHRPASRRARPPVRRSRMPSCVSSSTGAARDARFGCRTTPRWARAR